MSDTNHETPWQRVDRLERERREAPAETPWTRLRRLHAEMMVTGDLLDADDPIDDPPPRLTLVPDPTDPPAAPTTAELIAAMQAPGPLADQPAVQRLLRRRHLEQPGLRLEEQARDRQPRPVLRLVRDEGAA